MDDLRLTARQLTNSRSLGRPLIAKAEFLADLRAALAAGRGYAAGRIGMSQKHWLYYPILLDRQAALPKVYRLFERRLCQHGLQNEGIFPADPAFYLRFNDFYLEHLRNLDCLGLYLQDWDLPLEKSIVEFYGLTNKLIHYVDLQPDRQSPSDESACYLPDLRGRKVLLICPFASLLAERANRTTFEAVWARIGKRWFEPGSVEALEIPYGFAATTQARYATALELFDELADQIQALDFEVALIGAGGLAVPLASFVKSLGRVGLDVGGHLQMVFGVLGQKWRDLADWQAAYYNPAWIDMPARYRPEESDVCLENGVPGAYW
jgi:hypothetical protein